MSSGAHPHIGNDERASLYMQYRSKLIRHGGPIAWPARSPYLKTIIFSL